MTRDRIKVFKIKLLFCSLIVFLFPTFGADFAGPVDNPALADWVGNYINDALNLDCWQHNETTRKVGEIIKLQKYKGKQKDGYGNIIFIKADQESNPENKHDLYVKILVEGDVTHVKKNVLTFVLKDLFTEESVDSYVKKIENLHLLEKPSQKTGLFRDKESKKWFAKKYHEAGYPYKVIYVIAHELVHFMQYKQGDHEALTSLKNDRTEQNIINHIGLLKKYKSSFIYHISDIETALLALDILPKIREKQIIQRSENIKLEDIDYYQYSFQGIQNHFSRAHDIIIFSEAIITKIHQMEALVEESVLLGEQWGADSINEWRILRANAMPVRYPYSWHKVGVFELDDETVGRMWQSVFPSEKLEKYWLFNSLR